MAKFKSVGHLFECIQSAKGDTKRLVPNCHYISDVKKVDLTVKREQQVLI